jgi:hypothetical protein
VCSGRYVCTVHRNLLTPSPTAVHHKVSAAAKPLGATRDNTKSHKTHKAELCLKFKDLIRAR